MTGYDPLDPDADPFKPPAISTIVHCLHCGEEYDSYRIEWRVETNHDGKPHGFWCCPIPGCGGVGFGCDIFPVDPEYRDEDGNKMWGSDEESDEEYEPDGDQGVDENEPNRPESSDGEALPW